MGLSLSILKHSAIYSAATVLGRLVSFLMLPFYAHIFKSEGYGVIGMIDTSLSVLTVLLAGGFQGAILRIYHGEDENRKDLVLTSGIWMVWGMAGALILFPFLFSGLLSRLLLGSSEYSILFCLALLTLVVDVAGQSASVTQIIGQQSILFSFIGLVRLVLGLGLNIWLVLFLQVGLIGIFISSFVTAIVASVMFHIYAVRKHGHGFDRKIANKLWQFQLPLIPGEIVSFLGRQAERVLVRVMIGLEGMGVLEMAYKFPPLLNLFVNIPFQRAWRSKCIEIAAQEDAPQIIGDMFIRFLFAMVFVGLVLAVTIPSLLELMVPPEFIAAGGIAQIEIITTILNGCCSYLTFGLLYHKKTKTISIIKSVLVPAKIAIGFGMIAVWGLAGAAYSALLIEVITLGWIVKKSQALYRIPLEYGRMVAIVLAAATIFLLLNGNSYAGFAPADFIREQIFVPLTVLLRGTPLGAWKSGKLVHLLLAKQDVALCVLLNTVFSLGFLALFPFVKARVKVPESDLKV